METIIAAAIGCAGGIIRSSIGLFKARARQDKIRIGYIFRTIRLSALSGTIIGSFFGLNSTISFIAGYVGSDILEGVYSSIKRTKFGKKHLNI